MIKVCDSIMGSGKSSACINYMNEHPDKKYIYITPYLDEAKRIRDGCPDLDFYEPTNIRADSGHSKTRDTLARLHEGRNIATTHAAFSYYTPEFEDVIREYGYTLMIDEAVSVIQEATVSKGDLDLLARAGYIEYDGEQYNVLDDSYDGVFFRDIMRTLRSRQLFRVKDTEVGEEFIFWTLPVEFILAFDDVVIMTYLFEGQYMYYQMKMYNVDYQKIGIRHDESGYHFDDGRFDQPAYVTGLIKKIHICEHPKLNAIGSHRYALSMNWFRTNSEGVKKLKNNVYNYFHNIMGNSRTRDRMYGTFKDAAKKLAGKGFSNEHVNFNIRATNEYAHKTVLAYLCNVFSDGKIKTFLASHNCNIDEEAYALSTMVQWIFRSAIRNGEDIWIYIPSKRMRTLLKNWLVSLANDQAAA